MTFARWFFLMLTRGELRLTILYNPEARGYVRDGAIIPIRGSICGKAFWTGKTQHFDNIEDVRNDPESFGNRVGRCFYQRSHGGRFDIGLRSPAYRQKRRGRRVGRPKAVGERHFQKMIIAFLEQVARQVAIAVENALDYEKAIKGQRQGDETETLSRGGNSRRVWGNRRREPRVEDRVKPGIRRSAHGFERADPGRDGNRQRTHRACNPQSERPPGTGICQIELRRDPSRTSGE